MINMKKQSDTNEGELGGEGGGGLVFNDRISV